MVVKRIWIWMAAGIAAAGANGYGAGMVTAADLARELEEGNKLTLIDARTEREYAEGHLPGAIHVALPAIARRGLPPLGEVVVYGDGLGRVSGEGAMLLLDQKEGIRARVLAGGIAAWESAALPTTRPAGMTVEHLPHITYQQLAKAQREAVLVDLREAPPVSEPASEPGPVRVASSLPELTDLRSVFPEARVLDVPKPEVRRVAFADGPAGETAAKPTSLGALEGIGPEDGLLVLIDSGDGRAERMAELIRASGNRRVVILAGGEEILRHGGRSGTGRWGGSFYRRLGDDADLQAELDLLEAEVLGGSESLR